MLELDEEQEALLENIVKVFRDGQAWSEGALTWEEIEERRTEKRELTEEREQRLTKDIIGKTRQEAV